MNDLPNNAADSGDSDQGELTVTLPIGAANFRLIREYGLYYADKTKFLYPIAKVPLPYFLSRPRRFGKTLLLETLECILRGQKDLFKGLWIDQSNYRWTPYPIIRLEMNKVVENDVETMKETLSHQLAEVAKNEGVENLEKNSPKIMLGDLINSLYQDTHQTVAILIDEYDAPIVEHLSDPPLAEKFRDALREFYGILKTNVKATGHIFVTGVSRFTQTSIFSKLNNLNDLTFNRDYAAICGLTAADLEVLLSDREARTLEILIKEGCLPPESDGRDLRRTIRNWYDGYTWDGETRVYNPWSVLSALNKAEISSDWYTSGTPNFLRQLGAKVLQDPEWINNIPDIQETDTYIDEIDKIPPEVLLLQAGYLTIKDIFYDGQSREFSLEVPNLEVKAALWPLAQALDLVDDKGTAQKWAEKTLDCLLKLDALGVEEAFSFYLNQFKHPSFKTNESQYQIFLETAFRLAKRKYDSQLVTAHGFLDIHFVGPNGERFIVELKVYSASDFTPLDAIETNPDPKSFDAKEAIPDSQPFNAAKKAPKRKRLPPPSSAEDIAKLRELMTPKAEAALLQAREKYADFFRADGQPVILVALVMARRTFVLAKFETLES